MSQKYDDLQEKLLSVGNKYESVREKFEAFTRTVLENLPEGDQSKIKGIEKITKL